MITQRAWLVGVVGFCFYLIAIVNTLPSYYYALTWLLVGVLASSLGIALLSLIGLRGAWRVPRVVVTESAERPLQRLRDSDELYDCTDTPEPKTETGPTIEAQFANAGTLNKTGVLIEARLKRSDGKLFKRTFLLEALPSGNSISVSLPLTQLPRGCYHLEEVVLIGSDVLGLFRVRKRIPEGIDFESVLSSESDHLQVVTTENNQNNLGADEIVIGPMTLGLQGNHNAPVHIARGDSGVPATQFLGQGDDIRGTRLYAPGDDLRLVHWKSTARRGQLVVKEFHHTLQERVLVIWDGQLPDGATLKSAQSEALREWSLRLAASLCRYFIEQRRPCALLRLDETPVCAGFQQNTPTSSALTIEQMSELLAEANNTRETPLRESLVAFQAALDGVSEIYLVTGSLSPTLPSLVSHRRNAGRSVAVGFCEPFPKSVEKINTGKNKNALLFPERESKKYQYQIDALREAGARVARLPVGESQQNEASKTRLMTCLHELLDKDSVASDMKQSKNDTLPVSADKSTEASTSLS